MLLYHEILVTTTKLSTALEGMKKNILTHTTIHSSCDINISNIARWLWGDMNNLIKTLITFVLLAFLSTIILYIYQRNISKQLVLQELFKVIIIFMLIAMSHIIDFQITGIKNTSETITILYYVAHEGIIVLRNAAKLGIPVPQFLKVFLQRLRKKSEHHEI